MIYFDAITVVLPVGTDELNKAGNVFELFPNPTTGIVHLTMPEENTDRNAEIRVLNNLGVVVKKESLQNAHWDIDLSFLPKGIYQIQLLNDQGQFSKFILLQ